MKSILLTTTAIVAFAGAAAADGHISIGWSGTATAGVAREGGTDATAQATAALIDILIAGDAAADETTAAAALVGAGAAYLDAINQTLDNEFDTGFTAVVGAEPTAAEIAATRAALATALATVNSDLAIGVSAADIKAAKALIGATSATMDAVYGTLEVPTGEFDTYAEINATVTGSVATDNGLTLTAGMSVDAGMGYDFADDDGFDSKKTNGVGFDHVTLDAGTFGTLKFAPDDIAHLVDDDDDASVDVLYTNDFGIAKFSFALDIDTDSDVEASSASWELLTAAEGANATGVPTILNAGTNSTSQTLDLWYNPANAADVQWSAKVEAPVGDIATVYAAFDEEGGYDVGATATVAGVTVKAKAKSEALAVAQEADTEFDIHGSYTMSGLTVGAGWNSIEDGDQWRISGAYTMGAISVAASTDEGEDWEVTGSYDLGSGASLVGGVNYTEDAYVGVSFKF